MPSISRWEKGKGRAGTHRGSYSVHSAHSELQEDVCSGILQHIAVYQEHKTMYNCSFIGKEALFENTETKAQKSNVYIMLVW